MSEMARRSTSLAARRLRAVGLGLSIAAAAFVGAGCGSSSTSTSAPAPASTAATAGSGQSSGGGGSSVTTTAPSSAEGGSAGNGSSSTTGNGSASGSGCTNLTVTDAIRADLVAAAGAAGGETQPGHTYYGSCGTTHYAVAQFQAAPGASLQQQVSFQDDGSAQRFFVEPAGGSWQQVAQESYGHVQSCAGFTQAPAALLQLWQDCPVS